MKNRLNRKATQMSEHLCECGCGEYTMIVPETDRLAGYVKGQPRRFVKGHAGSNGGSPPPRRRRVIGPMNQCACGCGAPVLALLSRSLPGHCRLRIAAPSRQPYTIDAATGCWVWTGTKFKGYGRLVVAGRKVRAHRQAYEEMVGPIPAGHHLHHKCRNRLCVNPAHLEPLTPEQHAALHLAETV